MGIYAGVSSAVKTITGVYVGVGSATKTVSSVYVGVGGAAKLVWPDEKELTGDDATETFTLHNYASSSGERSMYSKYTSGSTVGFTCIESDPDDGRSSNSTLWVASDSTFDMSSYKYVNFCLYGCYASSTSGTSYAQMTPTCYFSISSSTDTKPTEDTYVSWSDTLGSSSSTGNWAYVCVNVSNCTKSGHIKIGYNSSATSICSYMRIGVSDLTLSQTEAYSSSNSDYVSLTYTG